MEQDHSGGWVQDDEQEEESGAGSTQPRPRSAFELQDLPTLPGVRELTPKDAPAELVAKLKGDFFKVKAVYQWDDVRHWKTWKQTLDASGQKDVWCFYGCPADLAEAVLHDHCVQPYPEFFPAVFGRNARYFYSRAEWAARIALRFLVAEEGLLMSCRLAPGRVFKAAAIYPQATTPPAGYDTVLAAKGMDIGFGPLDGEMFAVFAPERVLVRYIAHIVRK